MAGTDPVSSPRRGRPRKFDEEATLDAALEVFWSGGFESTSVPSLSAVTGLSSSSLYNAFGSKLGLYADALDRYLERVIGYVLRPLERGTAGLADFDAFLGRLATSLDEQPPRGCFAVNTIAEFHDPPPAIAELIERYRSTLGRALGAALTRSAAGGEIRPETVEARVRALVAMVVAFQLLVAARAPRAEATELLRAARMIAGG
jgi:AcrR family transcriptional regulator